MASPFWSYFHERLNWLPIFRPGPVSAIMKGLALHMDDVRADILWLRRQWNPVTCEPDLVQGYGESRGVFRNRFDSDESYRRRVIYAYSWHKLGGKVRGLERILAESGFSASVLQASDEALWAHFRVLLELGHRDFPPELASLFWFLANEYKPARSIIEGLITQTIISGEVSIGLGATQSTICQAFTWRWPLNMAQLPANLACALLARSRAAFTVRYRKVEQTQGRIFPALIGYAVTKTIIKPGAYNEPNNRFTG